MSQKFIFTMVGLRKVHPPNKEVVKGLSLSFFHGAKIGVLGHNGSGKSTLLRIMAGVDTDFQGEAFAAEGTRIGFLPQEPTLDPDKTVREEVESAVGETKQLLTRFEEIGDDDWRLYGVEFVETDLAFRDWVNGLLDARRPDSQTLGWDRAD